MGARGGFGTGAWAKCSLSSWGTGRTRWAVRSCPEEGLVVVVVVVVMVVVVMVVVVVV